MAETSAEAWLSCCLWFTPLTYCEVTVLWRQALREKVHTVWQSLRNGKTWGFRMATAWTWASLKAALRSPCVTPFRQNRQLF